MNVIEKFVKTVNAMDETILVPCRLMDLKVGDDQDPTCDKHNTKIKSKHSVQHTLQSTDLFEIYSMLKNVKDGLLWGGQSQQSQDIQETTLGKDKIYILHLPCEFKSRALRVITPYYSQISLISLAIE